MCKFNFTSLYVKLSYKLNLHIKLKYLKNKARKPKTAKYVTLSFKFSFKEDKLNFRFIGTLKTAIKVGMRLGLVLVLG